MLLPTLIIPPTLSAAALYHSCIGVIFGYKVPLRALAVGRLCSTALIISPVLLCGDQLH